jgi:type II restriction enzyme
MSKLIDIEIVLKNSLRNKFKNYKPKNDYMPFHTRLLGKDRMALYSFIQSLNTTFGVNIFEPVAKALAMQRYPYAETQQAAGTQISSEAFIVIQKIISGLTTTLHSPNKLEEIQMIRQVCRKGDSVQASMTLVDLKIVDENGSVYFFDLKTVKPNKANFISFKRTLLEWIAAHLYDNPESNIGSYIAIPYNPFYPGPYRPWTMVGMMDIKNELMVAEDFWDFLGGDGSYQNLLDIFEKVGLELREEIDEYFSRFNKK